MSILRTLSCSFSHTLRQNLIDIDTFQFMNDVNHKSSKKNSGSLNAEIDQE
jgi:hypothetical protein